MGSHTIPHLLIFSTYLISFCISLQPNDVVLPHLDPSESPSRSNFPDGFLFGASSSAYQYEGAWNKGGKGPSIWDTFTSEYPEKIANYSNGDRAEEFYYRYKEDIKMMKEMGITAFRLSISWSRILPYGKMSGGVNELGVQFYNYLINELLSNGITPIVTLFHWDTPQALEDEYGGFLSIKIVDDFRDYADICFELFGDRVKHWVSVNEPGIFSLLGYAQGTDAPGRCSDYIGNCTVGDSATEPYLVVHHLLLSHASAFRLYRRKYKENQGGVVGPAIHMDWMVPFNQTHPNVIAASRAFDFKSGWFVEPIMRGDYPETMRRLVGNRLPQFTEKESEMVKGSFDYLGVNYYSGFYVEDDPSSSNSLELSYTTDGRYTATSEKDGIPIGEPTGSNRICVYPQGLRDLLHYMMEKYDNPPLIITENGMPDWNDPSELIEDALEDYERIRYHRLHLLYLQKEIENGANVSGYLAWSFMDDFEWESGYTLRYGFNFIDRRNNLTRFPKLSAKWYTNFLCGENSSSGLLLSS